MDRITSNMKGRWHPEKKEGTTLKQQVKGVFKKDDGSARSQSHVAQPLSELKDPTTFGPPPTRVAGGSITSPATATPYRPQPAAPARPAYSSSSQQPSQAPVEEPQSMPYRVDTSGLSTSNLPPPPIRRAGVTAPGPPPPYSSTAKPTPPSLPPRLPPRATPSSPSTSPPPPARDATSASPSRGGYLNQSAATRLSKAGISVPELGIGKSTAPAPPQRTSIASPPSTGTSQLTGLQSRFAKLSTSSSSSSQTPAPPPNGGTTLAQKQAALQTAANFRKDPSSVSVSDAKAAAGTINNFRQRHGEQAAAGVQSANSLNQKYGVSDRVGRYAGSAEGGGAAAGLSSAAGLLGKKKPPPPPPKNPGLVGDGGPPPVPTNTRPEF